MLSVGGEVVLPVGDVSMLGFEVPLRDLEVVLTGGMVEFIAIEVMCIICVVMFTNGDVILNAGGDVSFPVGEVSMFGFVVVLRDREVMFTDGKVAFTGVEVMCTCSVVV